MYDKINIMRLRNSQEIKIYLEIQFRKLIFDLEKPTVSGLLKKISDLTREIQNESNNLPNDVIIDKKVESKSQENDSLSSSDKMEFFVKENFKGTDVDPSTMPEI